MSTYTIGLLLLTFGIIVFFGGNTLIGKKYKRYEKTPKNPSIGSLDPQIDMKEGVNLIAYFVLRILWFVLSLGLIMTGPLFCTTP